MSEASGLRCPNCGRSDALTRVADLPANGPVQIARPAPPRMPAALFGCRNVILVTLIAIAASIAIGGIAQLNAPPSTSAFGDLRPGDTAAFTGILAFMIIFSGLFAGLAWREMRSNTLARTKLVDWHIAGDRYSKLEYCSHCQLVFRPGGRAVAPAQADLLLYEDREKEP